MQLYQKEEGERSEGENAPQPKRRREEESFPSPLVWSCVPSLPSLGLPSHFLLGSGAFLLLPLLWVERPFSFFQVQRNETQLMYFIEIK